MGHDKHKHNYSAPETEETELTNNEAEEMQEEAEECETNHKAETCKKLLEEAKEKIADLEDKNLRMMAEFDNYRKRTNKEKLDLMATAGERIFKDMLPLVDDFERALASINGANGDNGDALLNGVQLIYQKFRFCQLPKPVVLPRQFVSNSMCCQKEQTPYEAPWLTT
jgi:molecular chaperone GrpE